MTDEEVMESIRAREILEVGKDIYVNFTLPGRGAKVSITASENFLEGRRFYPDRSTSWIYFYSSELIRASVPHDWDEFLELA